MSTLTEAAEHLEQRNQHIDDLLKTRLQLVARKQEVTSNINQLDKELIAIIGYEVEGSRTYDTGAYKVTTQSKMNRKVDAEAWAEIEEQIPEHLRPVKTKLEVDLKLLRALEAAQPELYQYVCGALITTPAKKSVKVQEQ